MNIASRVPRCFARPSLIVLCCWTVFIASGAAAAQCRPQVVADLVQPPCDASPGDWTGWAVAVSGDTAVVGGPNRFEETGTALVYGRTGSAWSRQTRLSAHASPEDQFGFSVAVSGDVIVIGAPFTGADDAGAAYIFVRDAGIWALHATLTASDPAPAARFGWSVGVSGDVVVVGATRAGHNGIDAPGAAYVFSRVGSVWTPQARLVASDPAPFAGFGYSVCLSGDFVVVGAPFADGTGVAYVFSVQDGAWNQRERLAPPEAAGPGWFGLSTSIHGSTALIGALTNSGGDNPLSGGAYVFVHVDAVWSLQKVLTASDAVPADHFGVAVAISGDTAVVGANWSSQPGPARAGAAYVFHRDSEMWTEQARLAEPNPEGFDYFGYDVALDGDTAIVGAYLADHSGWPDTGAAYVFDLRCGIPCPADFNADGAVTTQDFFDFLSAFFALSSLADMNGDGAINSQDFFDFLTAFFAGCP